MFSRCHRTVFVAVESDKMADKTAAMLQLSATKETIPSLIE